MIGHGGMVEENLGIYRESNPQEGDKGVYCKLVQSILSKVWNGRTMKDDKGDFSKNIWNQSLQQGIKEGSKGW